MVPRGEYRRMKSMYDEKGGVTNLIGNSKGASATINGYATKDGGEAKDQDAHVRQTSRASE